MARAERQGFAIFPRAAGFVFVGESEVLNNPADPHDKIVFDPTIRGHTDQLVFKFKKP